MLYKLVKSGFLMIIHIYAKVSNINSFYIFNNKSHADPTN
ncbi:hypothetical protein [uncultured Gammaproteobacteria bacterium]|nr:hypothetical protein BROOK1789B_1589 [Bathymodiolus brooksi thiotrophic gill symbiont]CAC9526278.1 hypothetical protein [uncultured Gammaproteobacteria bacterium]CAC9555111.1 hypothetical protein [uncultured Gammaproteobacteria bacterium]CAC9555313.1 hypothetical protein [uncultured Gammaproteobacteria bacterium]CAC9557705.1 hypothetical protein [uncultured Gammaproteobacteria bacterium]